MEDRIRLVRDLYEAWNQRDFDRQAEMMAPDGTIVLVGTGDVFEGPDGSRAYARSWADGFPDGQATVDNILADGDQVVVEFTGRGTHTGTFQTSRGAIAPTGRSLTIGLCDILRFSDDRIVSQRTYVDTGSVMAQLGLLGDQAQTTQH
jgi:uncharacterized protein (TIGR02246 family)